VFAMDFHLSVPSELTQTATYSAEGFLDRDKPVAKLLRKISNQEKKIAKLNKAIADLNLERGDKPKAIRKSDRTRVENTTSKLIIALLAEVLRAKQGNVDQQLTKLKNGANNNCVSRVIRAIDEMGWKMDESTVAKRLDDEIGVWEPA